MVDVLAATPLPGLQVHVLQGFVDLGCGDLKGIKAGDGLLALAPGSGYFLLLPAAPLLILSADLTERLLGFLLGC